MRNLLLVACVALPAAAQAQGSELRKCVGPRKEVAYTQSASPKGWKLHHSVYTYHELPPSDAQLAKRRQEQRQ